jgi:glycosyltransferase involved in cell wall biosynthesis
MLPELVKDNETGYVVEPEPDRLSERLKSILMDEERLRRFGENAKRVASETWNYDIQAATLKAFYERLIKTRHNPSS